MTKSCYFCNGCEMLDDAIDSGKDIFRICKVSRNDCEGFTPNAEWLEYMKLLDDQIAFREKAVNDLYEKDCKIKELQKENEELKDILKDEYIVVDVLGVNTLVTNPFKNVQEKNKEEKQ